MSIIAKGNRNFAASHSGTAGQTPAAAGCQLVPSVGCDLINLLPFA